MTKTENITFLRKVKNLNYQKRKKIEAWKKLVRPLSNRQSQDNSIVTSNQWISRI